MRLLLNKDKIDHISKMVNMWFSKQIQGNIFSGGLEKKVILAWARIESSPKR
jgi:ABC-type Mn2+/Zn2+ transport system ATPase subunit